MNLDETLNNAINSMGSIFDIPEEQRNKLMDTLFTNECIRPTEDNFYRAFNMLNERSRDIVRRRIRGEDFTAISSRYYLLKEEAIDEYYNALELLRSKKAKSLFTGEDSADVDVMPIKAEYKGKISSSVVSEFSNTLTRPTVRDVINVLSMLPGDVQFTVNNSNLVAVSFNASKDNIVNIMSK